MRWAVGLLLLTLGLGGANPVRAGAFDAEIAAFENADLLHPPPAGVIPFVGSSSFKIWSGLAADLPDHPVLNRGFGGSQMSDVLEYFDRVVVPYQPPLVVVYEGDNDLAAGKSVAQVFGDYSNFVWRVREQLPATDIAFVSVKPSPSRAGLLASMAELNGRLRDISDGRRIRFIDVFTPMLDGTGQPRPELFGADNLHMNAAGYALWTSIIGPALDEWAAQSGGTFLFDFGAAATTTERAAPPDDPLNYWNNVTETVGTSSTGRLAGLRLADGRRTSLGLEMLSRFNAANTSGAVGTGLFSDEATRDSLFGNTEVFNGLSNVFPRFKLTGLDTQLTYQLTFHAARTGVADSRETRLSVTGAHSEVVVLEPANNLSNVAVVRGLTASAFGELEIGLTPSPNNNNANHFTYLGVMKLEAIPPQRPISFLREPMSQLVPEGRPVSFTTAVAGSPPFFIQWFSNGLPVPGASQLTYTIPSVSAAMAGSLFSVEVSNLAFRVMSSNAVLRIGEPVVVPEPAAQVLWFDFGGANTTAHGPAPDDPTNYWNNVTTAIGTVVPAGLTNLVTTGNAPSSVGLVMLSRFNGANENGTTATAPFPTDATRDSLFGNTELFSGQSNVFPRFKLTGLNPDRLYRITFYASRTGVADNRETLYTVSGALTNLATLNAANNITNRAEVAAARPSASGELVISLSPGPNNNNANHFTYLGVLGVEQWPLPRHLPARRQGGDLVLEWSGFGVLESGPTVRGPWTEVSPSRLTGHAEPIQSESNRFFRLRQAP